MKRFAFFGVCGLCLGLSLGCGRTDNRSDSSAADRDVDISKTVTLEETGCLTASGDRFVLTALEANGGAAETELYQLVGVEDQLRQHVGREVRVTGMAEPAQIATVRESSAPAPVGTAGAKDGAQPEVRTESQTKIETRKMRVTTVNATGGDCATRR